MQTRPVQLLRTFANVTKTYKIVRLIWIFLTYIHTSTQAIMRLVTTKEARQKSNTCSALLVVPFHQHGRLISKQNGHPKNRKFTKFVQKNIFLTFVWRQHSGTTRPAASALEHIKTGCVVSPTYMDAIVCVEYVMASTQPKWQMTWMTRNEFLYFTKSTKSSKLMSPGLLV